MKIIALINQKGGVEKTTYAISIGAGLNKLNKRVLLYRFRFLFWSPLLLIYPGQD